MMLLILDDFFNTQHQLGNHFDGHGPLINNQTSSIQKILIIEGKLTRPKIPRTPGARETKEEAGTGKIYLYFFGLRGTHPQNRM